MGAGPRTDPAAVKGTFTFVYCECPLFCSNNPGEIAALTEIALPDIAVISNCGPEHLEHLVDLAGVRKENASVIHGLDPQGVLIVNGDDLDLLEAVSGYAGRRITFGFDESNDLCATDIRCNADGVTFRMNGRSRRVFVPMLGRHAACNALAAIAVARVMGISDNDAIESLASAHGPEMRLQLTRFGQIALLNDAYNANPSSMRAALETFSLLPVRPPGRRIAVLGDMLELGKWSDRYHGEIGEFVSKCPVDALVCVGACAELIANAAVKAGMRPEFVRLYPDSHSAAHALPPLLRDGDLVLLKASRGIRLEAVAHALNNSLGGQR